MSSLQQINLADVADKFMNSFVVETCFLSLDWLTHCDMVTTGNSGNSDSENNETYKTRLKGFNNELPTQSCWVCFWCREKVVNPYAVKSTHIQRNKKIMSLIKSFPEWKHSTGRCWKCGKKWTERENVKFE